MRAILFEHGSAFPSHKFELESADPPREIHIPVFDGWARNQAGRRRPLFGSHVFKLARVFDGYAHYHG